MLSLAQKLTIVTALVAYVEARFGQEQIPVAAVQALDGQFGAGGEAATLAGSIPSSLLAAASPCDKLALADEIAALGDDPQVLEAAIGLVSAETNFNPFAVDKPFVCADPALPATAALRGIVPLVDPAVTDADVANAASASSVTTPFNADGLSQAEVMIAQGFTTFQAVDASGANIQLAGQDGGAAGGAAGGADDAAGANDGAADQQDGQAGNVTGCNGGNAGNAGNAGNSTDTGNNNAGNDNAGNNNAGNDNAGDNQQDNNNGNDNAGDNQQDNNNGNNNGNGNQQDNNNGNDNAGDNQQDGNNGNDNGNNNDNGNAGNDDAGNDNAGGATDFGDCTPTMDFVGGRNGRDADEFTFLPTDPLVAEGQQEALNPNIITNRICDQLGNVCGANDAAIQLCEATQAQIEALGTRDQSTADDWNAALGF